MKKNNSDRGFHSIEALIIILVLMPIILATVDFILYAYKSIATATICTSVTRMVGIQGGVLNKAPAGFPGGDNGYMDKGELEEYLTKRMAAIGEDNWKLKIDGKVYSPSSAQATKQYDFLEDINVTLSTKYDFPFISSFLPGDQTVNITCPRATISEWKYNYDEWIGE